MHESGLIESQSPICMAAAVVIVAVVIAVMKVLLVVVVAVLVVVVGVGVVVVKLSQKKQVSRSGNLRTRLWMKEFRWEMRGN